MLISGCAAFWAYRGKLEPLDWASSLKGRLTEGRQLADLTWLRVGGPAEIFYQPADFDDLCQFMKVVPENVPVFPMGVGSNLIVRDGGMAGVVLRLGRAFADIRVEGYEVTAGAAALDSRVALAAADEGVDLTFLRTIPGSIGGAVRMNAGCYGTYVADHLKSIKVVSRGGVIAEIAASDLNNLDGF